MRDDIFKRVPRPRKVRQWVKCSSREADAVSGRSKDALLEAVRDYCNREISPEFKSAVRRLISTPADVSESLSRGDARWLSDSKGAPLERQVREGMRYHLAVNKMTLKEATVTSMEEALRTRMQSDIRAFEAVAHPDHDSDALRCSNQMHSDSKKVKLRAVAEDCLLRGLPLGATSGKAALSLDENLLDDSSARSGD